MKNEKGFTAIELVIFIVILTILAVFFVLQKIDLDASYADQQRKVSINAMYYSLTDVYYVEHGYYPSEIEKDTLKAIDPELLYDVFGTPIYESGSEYIYQGLACNGSGQCENFKLTAQLEKEADFVKESSK